MKKLKFTVKGEGNYLFIHFVKHKYIQYGYFIEGGALISEYEKYIKSLYAKQSEH